MPFGGKARRCSGLVFEDGLKDSANAAMHEMPLVKLAQGSSNELVQLKWPRSCRGKVYATIRTDNPV